VPVDFVAGYEDNMKDPEKWTEEEKIQRALDGGGTTELFVLGVLWVLVWF
jgi:hypothetical protein